jgi:lipopolysaccharide biosynthesis protein
MIICLNLQCNEFSELVLSSDLITQGINIINPSMEIKSFHMDLYKKLKTHTKKEVLYYILPHYIIDKPVVFNNAKELNAPVSEATNIATVAVKADPSYSIAVKSTSKKIALVIHLYYHDLWDEMKTYINNLSTYNFDLYITLDKTSSTIGQNMWMKKVILKSYPTANILDIDNKGMDIGAFLQVLKYIKHNNLSYDYVCKIHTKKSIKSSGSTHGKVFGIHWRKKLIEPLLGSVENVERCLAKLSDERTALVTMNTNVSTFMSTNTEHVNYIKNMLNIRSGQLFVAGTMFWMKYNVLDKYFYNEDIIDSTYNILENGYTLDQEKGTYTHAMERIFGYMITDAKYNFGTI